MLRIYTGNLETADGRHFGYQLTFFRRGLTPDPAERSSKWATDNVYMAHFALTDVGGKQFFAQDRYSRDGAGLAGAQASPFRVWIGDWEAVGDPQTGTRLRADGETEAGTYSLDLVARSTKPPVLQGDNGLSQKSNEPGNASYYYSLTRMATEGTMTINGETFEVTGLSWQDREWSTSVLGPGQIGWDWFALQLSDGTDIMYYQVRRDDGTVDPLSKGSFVPSEGTSTLIRLPDVQLDVIDTWRSPRSGGEYPSGWRMQIPSQELDLQITPYIPDQELPLSIVYWEGAVRITGTHKGLPVTGSGYVEMTGYADPVQGATRPE